MKRLYNLVEALYDKKVNSLGLALFRITFFIVMLLEVNRIYEFRQLIFDVTPFVEAYELSFGNLLILWQVILVLVIVGFKYKWFSVINYCFTLFFLSTISSYEYHVFYSYTGVSFFAMFMPMHKSISIDYILKRIKYSRVHKEYYPDTRVSTLNYSIIILFGIAVVYFDSIFYKLSSDIWMRGLGVWLPSSLPQASILQMTWLLENEYVIKGLGYLTIAFETVFLFTFWREKWKLALLVVGAGLHLGINIAFPIPLFAFGVLTIYFLMIPFYLQDRIKERFAQFKESNKKKISFYYDGECPLCLRTKIVLESLDIFGRVRFVKVQDAYMTEKKLQEYELEELYEDIFSIDSKGKVNKGINTYIKVLYSTIYLIPLGLLIRIPGIYHLGKKVYSVIANNREVERCTEESCGIPRVIIPDNNDEMKIFKNFSKKKLNVIGISIALVFMVLVQLFITSRSGVLYNVTSPVYSFVGGLTDVHKQTRELAKEFLGLTSHPVFMDAHFRGYSNIYAVVYKNGEEEIWLPIIDKDGSPDTYVSGFTWVNWTFRVNSKENDSDLFEKGVKRYAHYWAGKNNKDIQEGEFIIYQKIIDYPEGWEKNFLVNQRKKKWRKVGEFSLSKNEYIRNDY